MLSKKLRINSRLLICSVTAAFWIVLLLVTLYELRQLPVYTDEISYRAMNSRAIFDNNSFYAMFPSCRNVNQVDIPKMWVPIVKFENLLFNQISNHKELRLYGILIFSVVLIGFGYLASCIHKSDFMPALVTAFTIGIAPITFVMTRPELFIISDLIFIIIFWYKLTNDHYKWELAKSVLVFLLFNIITISILTNHAKTLFLLPFFLVISLDFLKKPKVKLLGVLFPVSIISNFFVAYNMWNIRQGCNESIEIQNVIQRQGVPPALLLHNPQLFFHKVFANISNVFAYIEQIQFKIEYPGNWIPAQISFKANNYVFINNLLIAFCLLLMMATIIFCTHAIAKLWIKQNILTRKILGITLFISILCLTSFQTTKNFYEINYFFPLLIICISLLYEANSKIHKFLIIFILITSVPLSTLSLYEIIKYSRSVYTRKIEIPGVRIDDQIKIAELKDTYCDIANTSQNIIVDDITYFKYKNSMKPILISYYLWDEVLLKSEVKDIGTFLKNVNSDGLVVSCERLPEKFRYQAHQDHGICCYK